MRRLLIPLLLLLSLHCGAQHSLYDTKFKLSKKNFADSIEIDCPDGRVVLPVCIGGKVYRFLFDTGASQTTLFEDSPIEGLTSVGFTVSTDALNHVDTVRKVALPPMTIGSVMFTGCKAVVRKRILSRLNIDGIVGFDIICKGLNVKIDLRDSLFILTDKKKLFSKEPSCIISYQLNYHVPYVEASPFAGFTENVLFDTGSPFFYMMNKKSFDCAEQLHAEALSSLVVQRGDGPRTLGHSGAEAVGEVVTLQLASLCIGPHVFSEVPAFTTQGNSHIGAALLQRGALVILHKPQRFYFQPYPETFR